MGVVKQCCLQTQALAQLLRTTPCDFDLRIMLAEPEGESAVEPRLDLAHEPEVDDVLAANAEEELR
ncbi:MAG: hypothetical protein ACRD5Z_09905, partial [Bryobacteraceae bacterium]